MWGKSVYSKGTGSGAGVDVIVILASVNILYNKQWFMATKIGSKMPQNPVRSNCE